MDAALSTLATLIAAGIAVASKIGDLTFPMLIVFCLLGAILAGERGLKAAGATIIVAAVLLLCLHNAQGLATWFQQPTMPAAVSTVANTAAGTQH